MNPYKATVRTIIETVEGFSRVVIDAITFRLITETLNAKNFNSRPENKGKPRRVAPLKFTTSGDEGDNGVYSFEFQNGTIHVNIHKTGTIQVNPTNGKEYDEVKTIFLMAEAEAEACHMTLEEQRANTPKLPFNVNKFNLDVVATA